MKKIFIVTGGNGFLGNNIVRKLLENNDNEVRVLIYPQDPILSLTDLPCKIFYGDVTKIETLKEIFDVDPEALVYVIHCAAIVYIKSRFNQKVYDVNVNGTKNIVEKTLEIKAKLIYVNSVHSIPEKKKNEIMMETKDFNPDLVKGLYAKTKAIAAGYVLQMVKEKDLNACIIQPSGIIGPNDYGNSHLTQLIIDFTKGRLKACVKGGYDFVDVRDVADGIIASCNLGKKGECYILANKFFEIKELLDIISQVMNLKPIKTVLPMWLAKLTAPLSEIYYQIKKQPPLYTKYSLYTLTSNSLFSSKKAKEELGYTNRNIDDTLKATCEWLQKENRLNK